MPRNDAPLLIVATAAPAAEAIASLGERFADRSVTAVYLGDDAEAWPIDARWTRWTRGDLEDLERLRGEFLAFLDAWPRQRFSALGGKSFDEALRLPDGYSIWWTGPGVARHPDHGVFTQLRDVWSIAAAIERSRCGSLVLLGPDRQVAAIVAEKCRESGIAFEVSPPSAPPASSDWSGRWAFLFSSLVNYLGSPFAATLRAFLCNRRVRYRPEPPQEREQPAVVMTALFPREFRVHGDRAEIAFWSEVSAEFERATPHVRLRHLLHTTADRFANLGLDRWHCHRAWPELRKLAGLAPLPNQTVGWRAWLKSAWPLIKTLAAYCRLERTSEFRGSFRFAGCDVAPLYAPLLRRAIGRVHKWSHDVAAFEASLRAVGNVRAVLLMGELYPFAMPVIAAARNLGIATIGAQHGTIFPMHLMYTPPPGQIDAAPTPDRFAAYGEFSEATLCEIGAFPKDRVAVVGSPRFEHLVRDAVDSTSARDLLELPRDKRVIVLATQIYPWFKLAARALFEAVRERGDVVVCVKMHPHDRTLDEYRRLTAEVGAANVRFYADRFAELLAACDVLVSGSSTATLEAILLGRRTICINFSTEPDRYPYVAEGGSLGATNAAGLHGAIAAALDPRLAAQHETARRQFLERHLGPTVDGRAASAFVDLVLRTIAAGESGPALKNPSEASSRAAKRLASPG